MTEVTGIDHIYITVSATNARLYPEYAEDYCATFFSDPDGVRLEVTNWRRQRRQRAAHWDDASA